MNLLRRLCLFAGACLLPLNLFGQETIDLAGSWQVGLDPSEKGREERWFSRDQRQSISLPGSLEQARIGEAISPETKWTGSIFDKSYFSADKYAAYRKTGNIKVPFWLQPDTHYTGHAWFTRRFEIPTSWDKKQITLFLERPHWKTTVWLDDQELGSRDSLSVAHVYDLGTELKTGSHRLTILVDNTLDPDIGENSHSVSDHTQGNWNGVVGRIQLLATSSLWIDDLQVDPQGEKGSIGVRGQVHRAGNAALPARVSLSTDLTSGEISAAVNSDGSFAASIALPKSALSEQWDEFTPKLHHLTAKLENAESREVTFGLRSIRSDGRQLTINGRPLFLRGTLDCAAYPRTGYPPTDLATWKQVMSEIKAHGLNHIRFHSWCPPEAAFTAADELGLYLQIEVATWPNWSTTIGDGKPVDAWVLAETERILKAYGNHPSFIMLCAGNEPGGDHHAAWLEKWVIRQKTADPRRLYTSGAGWPELAEDDYHLTAEPRIQHWSEGLRSRINARPPETTTDYGDFIRERNAPVVSHEIGQWCVYPNFAEMPKYTGYLKPRNFEIFQESLAAHGLADQAHEFLIASGKLQALCYKEEIESALRTSQMGGFQLLGLSDFPGQGTALVGVLDAFWEEKGYISPAEFRRFSSSTVPLLRLAKRVFTTDETISAEVEVAHYGRAPLQATTTTWSLKADDGQVAAQGSFTKPEIAIGERNLLGKIELPLKTVRAPARYKLVVNLKGKETSDQHYENDWDVWIYPAADQLELRPSNKITVATAFDHGVQQRLENGETVVLLARPENIADDESHPIALGFSSIFWNTAWTNGQAPHTLGIVCDPKNPALADFPTDGWSNWQWWYPITHAAPMILDGLPRELRPIVQVIDDWATNRKLALIFEARVGQGRLLLTSINLNEAALDPVRRQLRASLLAYANSDRFQPKVAVTREQVLAVFKKQ